MRVQTSPRLVRARMRQEAAIQLRAVGMGYDGIAKRLGYGSRASAYKAVREGLKATQDRAALAYRVLLYLRFEGQVDAFVALMEAGDLSGLRRLLDDKIAQAEQEMWRCRRWGFPLGA